MQHALLQLDEVPLVIDPFSLHILFDANLGGRLVLPLQGYLETRLQRSV